jgi:DNA/RNA endonuclease G (NUC1)
MIQTSLVLYEDNLLEYAESFCKEKKIQYFRIPDKFWKWVNMAVPTGVRCWIYKIFGYVPDMIAFVPIGDYCVSVNVELKRKYSYLRKGQKEASKKLPWLTVKSIQEFENVISNLLEIQSHFLTSPIGILGSDRSNSQKQAKNGKKEHVSGY